MNNSNNQGESFQNGTTPINRGPRRPSFVNGEKYQASTGKEELTEEKMLTPLNKRIYKLLTDILSEGKTPDISSFADKLLPAELGYIVNLQNGDKAAVNPKAVLRDSIRVILEEESRIKKTDIKEMSTEDWASDFKKLIDKKSKGN